jgi:hypothetical protein
MRVIFLTLCLFLEISISFRSYCQKEDKLILKFAPLDLIDPYGENIHLGSEFILNSPLTFETDFSAYVGLYNRNKETPRIADRIGFKIKPEIRYYLNSKEKTVCYRGFYVADELYFITDKFKRGDTFRHYDQALDTSFLYHDYERIKRFVIGNNFKIGYQAVTKFKLIFDFYFGIGLKYYNGSYDYKVPDPICCPVMRFFEIPVYKGIKPSITFGIKLGYAI